MFQEVQSFERDKGPVLALGMSLGLRNLLHDGPKGYPGFVSRAQGVGNATPDDPSPQASDQHVKLDF